MCLAGETSVVPFFTVLFSNVGDMLALSDVIPLPVFDFL